MVFEQFRIFKYAPMLEWHLKCNDKIAEDGGPNILKNKWIFNISIKPSYDFEASSGEVAALKSEYSLRNFNVFEAAAWWPKRGLIGTMSTCETRKCGYSLGSGTISSKRMRIKNRKSGYSLRSATISTREDTQNGGQGVDFDDFWSNYQNFIDFWTAKNAK